MKDILAHFKKPITKEQSRDTGMALVLVLLLVRVFTKADAYLIAAIVALVINMTAPQLYRPLAVVWLGFSHLLGTVMSRVILTVIYVGIVTPVAVLRRLAGKDSLKLQAFRAGETSVMLVRNHKFTGKDIEKPY